MNLITPVHYNLDNRPRFAGAGLVRTACPSRCLLTVPTNPPLSGTMPLLRRLSFGSVVVIAICVIAGCAAPERDVIIKVHPEVKAAPPVGYWVVDAKATAHAVVVKRGEGGFNLVVEGQRTNYTYETKARDVYDDAIRAIGSASAQRSLVLRADGTGEDWATMPKALRTTHTPFHWSTQGHTLTFQYADHTVEAEFPHPNEIRYPVTDGMFIFGPQN